MNFYSIFSILDRFIAFFIWNLTFDLVKVWADYRDEMSENLTETFHGQEKFESSHTFDQEQQQEQPNETQIFELINQLNDAFANNSKQQQESNLIRSIEPISSESNTNPIQNESSHSSNNKSDTQDASNKLANESKANSTTKIPRIPYLRKSSMNEPTLTAKLSEHLTNKPVSNSNSLSAASSNNSISTTASTNHSSTRQPQQQQRVTRSTIKSAGNSSSSSSKDVSSKRGISLSKNASTSTKARAASITAESREELLNSLKNTKQVKYVIKHQPKQSQVKIFSQKLELKNVSSKIGSLEKATYAPGGGNVKVNSLSISSHE